MSVEIKNSFVRKGSFEGHIAFVDTKWWKAIKAERKTKVLL